MEMAGKKILVCNCEQTMPLDSAGLTRACGASSPPHVHRHLCRSEIERFYAAFAGGGPVLVACTQEAPLFRELQEAQYPDAALSFVNIRERAGWSAEAG